MLVKQLPVLELRFRTIVILFQDETDDTPVNNVTLGLNTSTTLKGSIYRVPKRILHFSDGTLEEYSSDDDCVDNNENLVDSGALIDPVSCFFSRMLEIELMMGVKLIKVHIR